MITRTLVLAGGVAGAAILSQFPEYAQQYTQRLGGAVDALGQVVADFDDDTIDAIAAHYAALPFVPAKQDFDAGLAATGKAIHEEHCDKCHSDGGSNPDDEAGILAGQWMGYLETTFAQYAADEREQPSSMRDKMEALSDADVTALIHYYASQQ